VSNSRPKTRAGCQEGPRPCPWVSCRYSLFFEQEPGKRRLQVLAQADVLDLEKLYEGWLEQFFDGRPTCALDLADSGPEDNLETIGATMCMSKDETRMTLVCAKANLANRVRSIGLFILDQE